MSEPRLHVMFSPSSAATLKQALSIAGRRDEVLCLFDNFSFGPIATDDAEARIRWIEQEIGYTGVDEITHKSAEFLAAFDVPTAPISAWVSWRETMTCAGFLWWLSHLKEIPVSVIDVPELSITNDEGMIELLDKAAPLSAKMRSHYESRWRQLQIENAPFRIISDGELISAPIDYFDSFLLNRATNKWQKMARIVAYTMVEFYDAGADQAGDLVLGARLASLAETGKLEWQGDLSNMRRCELRLPAS